MMFEKKNYSEEIATAKSAKRQVINETRKLDFDNSEQKSYLKDKIYNLKHRTIKFHILASFASIVTIVSLILVLFITGTEEDQENIQRAWTPDTLGDWGVFLSCASRFSW